MKRERKISIISAVLSLPILLGSLPALVTNAFDTSSSVKIIEVQGSYSSGASHQWESMNKVLFGEDEANKKIETNITIDPSTKYQEYQGIGVSLEETSVSNLWKLDESQREEAVKKMVDPVNGAGIGLFRLTIGSPDCIEHLPFWSYDELPEGVTEDWNLDYFSIEKDRQAHIIDTIKLIQKYNPNAQFFGSAWSAPAWMKTKNKFIGYVEPKNDGSNSYVQANKLRDDCINVFARYYVKTIQAFAEEGINIRAITLLNEPGMDVVYPAMDISIEQQQKLAIEIKQEFAKANLNTELWMHDFNFWDWKDPSSTETKNYYRIFEDSKVAKGEDVIKAADGVAFHPYWGDSSVMGDVAKEFPEMSVHLTESGDFSPGTVVKFFNDYASSFTGWTPITDQNGGTLHWTDERSNDVDWTKVNPSWKNRLFTVNTNTKAVTYTNNFYGLGQFSKYLKSGGTDAKDGSVIEGARRVFSTGTINGISNVTFENPDGEIVMILSNTGAARDVKVNMLGKALVQNIPGYSTTTLRWNPELNSKPHNKVPVLKEISEITMDQYATKTFKLEATDDDNDTLMFYGIGLPEGITVDSKTGLVTLMPSKDGEYTLTFVASDGNGKDTKTMKIIVCKKSIPIDRIVEAENYSSQYGWTDGGSNFIESNGSASGGKNVGYTKKDNWLKYKVIVPAAGVYNVEFGVANGSGSDSKDSVSLKNQLDEVLTTISVPNSNGWSNWITVKSQVELQAGEQEITLYCNAGNFNLDYMKFTATVDKSSLLAVIDDAENIDTTKYTDESVELLNEAVENGKVLINAIKATQLEVDTCYNDIKEKMEQLVLIPEEPNQPEEPTEPENPSNNKPDEELPQTGGKLGMNGLLAIGGIILVAGVFVYVRKNKTHKE